MALNGALPSIYDQLGPLAAPVVDLHAQRRSATDRKQLELVVQTCQQGTAGTFLRSVLEQSHTDAIRNWRKRSSGPRRGAAAANDENTGDTAGGLEQDDDVDDDEELELRERGFVHKRRSTRTRSASVASVVSAEGDDELGSETEVAHHLTTTDSRGTRSHKDKVQTSRRRLRRLRDNLRIPDVQLDEPDLPPDFPPSDLFTALHDRAAKLYSSRHNLLPPLTPSEPFLPETDKAHFEALHARLNAKEERAIRQGSKAVVRAWKRTRIAKANAGERKGVWTDASRAFEGSALVALGLLTNLLVEDAVASEAERLPDLPPAPP